MQNQSISIIYPHTHTHTHTAILVFPLRRHCANTLLKSLAECTLKYIYMSENMHIFAFSMVEETSRFNVNNVFIFKDSL